MSDHLVLPRDKGKVDGGRAQIRQSGDSIDALYNFREGGEHDHLISHDGVTADYVREGGRVVIDKFQFVAAEKEGYIREVT